MAAQVTSAFHLSAACFRFWIKCFCDGHEKSSLRILKQIYFTELVSAVGKVACND